MAGWEEPALTSHSTIFIQSSRCAATCYVLRELATRRNPEILVLRKMSKLTEAVHSASKWAVAQLERASFPVGWQRRSSALCYEQRLWC